MTTLIPIGRFSRLTRLSAKALRLYDEMRLLVPAHVDLTTGYRYYSDAQARRAVIIGALRAVEMPLDEIRAFVETDDDAAADQWLLSHRARVAQRLVAQQEMLALIDAYVGNKPSLAANEIELVPRTAMRIAAVRIHTSQRRVAHDVHTGFGQLARALVAAQLTPVGTPMLVYHDLIDEQNDGELEIAVPVDVHLPASSTDVGATAIGTCSGLYGRVMPASTLATIVHRGPFTAVASAYRRVFDWIQARGLEITGPVREVYLTDPATVASANLLTRVEIPVEAER